MLFFWEFSFVFRLQQVSFLIIGFFHKTCNCVLVLLLYKKILFQNYKNIAEMKTSMTL